MAKRPLKVFRTSAGFQDAYVAATSQKAALEAWGARKNLFANGFAEVVTDPNLTKAALAEPGKVIRAPKGTAAQHLAAAGKMRPKRSNSRDQSVKVEALPRPATKRPPRPSRSKLDKAEKAIEERQAAFSEKLLAIDRRIEELRQDKEKIRADRDAALTRLEERRAKEESAYRLVFDAWNEE